MRTSQSYALPHLSSLFLSTANTVSGVNPLTPDDIAEVVVFAASRPENVVIANSLIFPQHQVRDCHALLSPSALFEQHLTHLGRCWSPLQEAVDSAIRIYKRSSLHRLPCQEYKIIDLFLIEKKRVPCESCAYAMSIGVFSRLFIYAVFYLLSPVFCLLP